MVLGVELLATLHGIIISIKRNVFPILLFSAYILSVQAMNDFDVKESILDDDHNESLICASEDLSYVP